MFSKLGSTVALKNKIPQTKTISVEESFEKSKRSPNSVKTDRAKEF